MALNLDNRRHFMQKRTIKTGNLKLELLGVCLINYPGNFENLAKIKTIKKS